MTERRMRPWQVAVRSEATRLRTEAHIARAASARRGPLSLDEATHYLDAIEEDLREAEASAWLSSDDPAATHAPGRWFGRLWHRVRPPGIEVEAAWSALRHASEVLLLVQPTEAIVAQIPRLRTELKERLPATDGRFEEYLKALHVIERDLRDSDDGDDDLVAGTTAP